MVDALCEFLRRNIGDLGIYSCEFDRLLDACPDINARDWRGITALQLACMKQEAWRVHRLLKRGADPNTITASGYPVVYFSYGHREALNELVDFGADVNVRGPNGFSPWHNMDHAAAYRDAGADIMRWPLLLLVLSFVGLPRGVAMRVVEWMLKC